MLRLKYLTLLFLCFLSLKTNAQDPNWNSMLTVPPNPSPYFSDWENNPNNITYSLQYLGQGSANVILEFHIESEDIGEIVSGNSEVIEFTSGPEQKDITGTELVNWDETTWNKDIETQVLRTGRFPEGNYEACIMANDLNNNRLTQSCIEFSISYPDPPYLIAPLTDENILFQFPTFQWSPVINNYSNETINYLIRIVEILKGQTPEQAIAANYPHYEDKTTATTFSYPPSAQLLEKGKTYAWQIQALDMNDIPISSNNGKSVIWTFKFNKQKKSNLSLLDVEYSKEVITYSPENLTNKVDVNISYQGGGTVQLDSVINYWYRKKDDMLFKVIKDKATSQSVLSSGEVIKRSTPLKFTPNSLSDALQGQSRAEYYVDMEYIAKDKEGNRVIGKTKTPLIVKCYSQSENQNNIVEFVTKEIKYTPNILQNKVKIKFTHYADLTSPYIQIDSSIFCWYKEDNSLFFKDKDQTSFQPFRVDYAVSVFDIEPYFDYQTFISALNGKDSATYWLHIEYIGREKNGKKVTVKTKSPLMVKFYATTTQSPLNVEYSKKVITYSPKNLTNKVDVNISYQGGGTVQLDSVINYWYRKKDGKLFKVIKDKATPQTVLNREEIIKRPTPLKFTPNSLSDALQGQSRAEYYVDMEYIAKDKEGNRVIGKTKIPLSVVCLASAVPGLNTEFVNKVITYSPNHLKNNVDINLFYLASSNEYVIIDSVVNSWFKKSDNSLFKRLKDSFVQPIKISGGTTLRRKLKLELDSLSLVKSLFGKSREEYFTNIEYIGKNEKGEKVRCITKTPLIVKCFAADSNKRAIKGTNYEIIPGKAFIQPLTQTIIKNNGNNISVNGLVKLIFTFSSSQKDSAYVEANNLTFTKNNKGIYKVNGGTFFKEVAPDVEEELFHFKYQKILKVQVQSISFNYNRPNKLLLKEAFSKLPVISKKLFFKDLIVDENGLDFKVSKQEFKVFGLVFIVKEIKDEKFNSGNSKFSLGVGIRLDNKKFKPEKDEFFSGKLVFQKVKDGETTIKLEGATDGKKKLISLIPYTHYLDISSIGFVQKPNKNWAIEIGISSAELPIYSKINKDPIKTTFMLEKSGKMSGKLELINETTHGYDNNDKTVLEIGKFGAIDLTYLGFQLEQIQKITTVDSKLDTSYVFDFDKCKIGISADLYIKSKGKKLNDVSNAIYIGDIDNPGITIDFEGVTKTKSINVVNNRELDFGPIFIKLKKLAVTPYPFELAISGEAGVAMKEVFSGGIQIENMKIDENGNWTSFGKVIKGGNLSIIEVLKLEIGSLKFNNPAQGAKLNYAGKKGKKKVDKTINVSSYFELGGAKLSFGKSGAAGGGVEKLIVYETKQGTNFLLKGGELKIENTIDLTVDVEYVNKNNEEYLSVGGNAKILKKYGATVYGKIGHRDNDATWGFYVSVQGIDIPLGPVTLDEVGGGFFYRPTKEDIRTVTSLAGFKHIKLSGYESKAKPTEGGSQAWAIFINAGMYVGGREFIHGRALVTVTNSYFKLDAEIKALKEKAHGKAYLNINWEQDFVEGKFQFGVDFVVIKAKEENNYFQFYAYNKSKWGVMGKMDIRSFFIKTTADVYVGNQGFLFDFALEESIDISLVSGGFRIEAMTWWRKDVNWGIYASGKAWGDVLGGLVGAEIGLEGALVSNPFLIYVGGHLSVEVCWVTVFNGRAWITVGEDGLDGGTGSNKKFDKLIADARNVGKQMKKEMEDMKKELQNTRDALYRLSNAQRFAAGKALLQLSIWAKKDGLNNYDAVMFKVKFEKDLYKDTLDMAYSSTSWVNKSIPPEPSHKKVFDLIWNSEAKKIDDIKNQLKIDSIEIAKALNNINAMENQLSNLLTDNEDLLQGKLPTISELGKLSSPVTTPQPESYTIKINNVSKTISIYNYNLDSSKAINQKNKVANQKTEMEAYQKQLITLIREYSTKLKRIREIISGNKNSIKAIANKYAVTFNKISKYTTDFMDYLAENQNWANNQTDKLKKLKVSIDRYYNDMNNINDLFKEINWTQLPTFEANSKFKKLCLRRVALLDTLVKRGAAKDFKPPTNDITYKNYADMGKELYYKIPLTGYQSVTNEMDKTRQNLVVNFKTNNDIYQANWNRFTLRSDKVYSRQVKLYTILYDLLDQLSFQAGTRKLENNSNNLQLVNTGRYSTKDIVNTIPIVSSTGKVGVSSSNSYTFTTVSNVGTQLTNFSSFVSKVSGVNTSVKSNNKQNNLVYGSNGRKRNNQFQVIDYEKERIKVKKILQIPKIIHFSGKAISNKNTLGYAKLTLSWKGTHPVGIAEYSFSIDGYSDVVQMGSNSYGNTTTSDNYNMNINTNAVVGTSAKYNIVGWRNEDNVSKSDVTEFQDTDLDKTLSSGDYSLYDPNAGELKAWRTIGDKENIVLPFLMGVHKPGNYEIWLRVRGAGGYTIERLSGVNIEYCGGTNMSTGKDFDWSDRESSLNTTDTTPPTTPSVTDNGDQTKSTKQIFAKWSATDYESGIQEYQYRVTYENNAGRISTLLPWVSAGGQTEMNIRLNEKLVPGRTYYVEVKALNGVGKWSEIGSSDGIQLTDPTPPTKPSFTRTGRKKGNIDYVTSLNDTLFHSTWYPASDPESKIMGYLFSVGTAAGTADVIDWCATQSTEIRMNKRELSKILNVKLQKNTTYYLSVKAMNGIGIVGEAAHLPIVVQ